MIAAEGQRKLEDGKPARTTGWLSRSPWEAAGWLARVPSSSDTEDAEAHSVQVSKG